MIPEETISRVRESVDIVELVRESVPGLKKSGRNFHARCPFHQERTPSFNVNPEMGLFKCFGCGVGGDAFKFVMLNEGLTYPEAIRKLAGRVGVTIVDDIRSPEVSAEAKEREVLYGLLENAARFYHRHLLESADAAAARVYLEKRGLTKESLVKFAIGFAPASGQALREAAVRKGWSLEILEKAGLLRRKEDSGRIYDHFWNRIIFPIWDTQGRIVAFGGRVMGDGLPKYINSPETPIYSKSRHLYGLFQGLPTLRKRRHVVILEGYMDVVACHQYGFDFTAATLGTALTEEHVRLMRRYAERVTLLFDPDAAGAHATLRGGEILIAEGFMVGVVTLPDGVDPDEVLQNEGQAALERHLQNEVPFMDYFVTAAMTRHPGLTPESKLAVAKDVLPLIRKMKDPLLQDEHLSRLAGALRAEKTVLALQMKKLKTDPDSRAKPVPVASAEGHGLLPLEEEILLTALLYPSEQAAALLDGIAWEDDRCRTAWPILRTFLVQGAFQLSEALTGIPEVLHEWLTVLAMQQRNYPQPAATLEEMRAAWRRRQKTSALLDLKTDVESMIDGKIPLDARKVQVYNELSRELKGSKVR